MPVRLSRPRTFRSSTFVLAFLTATLALASAVFAVSPIPRNAAPPPPDRLAALEELRATLPATERPALAADFSERGLPKLIVNEGGYLTGPEPRTARIEMALRFLRDRSRLFGLSLEEISNLEIERHYADPDGTEYVRFVQTVGGIPVFHGLVQFAFDREGRMLQAGIGDALPGLTAAGIHDTRGSRDTLRPTLTDEMALRAAYAALGHDGDLGALAGGNFELIEARRELTGRSIYRNPLGGGMNDILSELMILPGSIAGAPGNASGEGAVDSHLAWHLYLDLNGIEYYEVLIDAHDGELLFAHNLYTNAAQGTVWTTHPSTTGSRSLESFVGDTTINTSAGWMGTSTVTTGNNVDAYLDTNADNLPDANNGTGLSSGRASSATQDFTFSFGDGLSAQNPRSFQPACVSNLFYFNNLMHDFTYSLGFTEAAGNFQTNNFGRGGLGSDAVNAEAQDGSGTDNANFATPPDGQKPRMQMFLFTRGTTSLTDDLDGDYDGDVVLHEYGHGVSNRIVGGPSNTSCLQGTQSAAMGEGWSDYWPSTRYGDPVMGEYVAQNFTSGIRRYAYGNGYAWGYASLGNGSLGFEEHDDGEVWANTLWDMRQTAGAAVADALVIAGMKLTVCSPSMVNARDGIIQADTNNNGGANLTALWHVFARHGLGSGAAGNDGTTHTPGYALPAANGSSFSNTTATSIPDNNTTGATSTISVSGLGSITRLSVIPLVTHTWIGDVVVDLISPGGTVVNLWNQSSGNANDGNDNITRGYDLTNFNGQSANGTWSLRAKDLAATDTGTFTWRLDISTGAGSPDFGITVSPTSVSVTQGGSGTTTGTITSVNGFSAATTLSASGLPAGVTASFSPASVTPPANGSAASTLTLTASGSASTGTVTVTVTGTSGATTHSTTFSLTVNAAAAPDFSIGLSPSSVSIAQGGSGTSTTTVTSLNGFSAATALSASGLPAGVTASFAPSSVTPAAGGSASSTLTLTASASATTGTFTVTVTGTAGVTTHSTTLSLTVTGAGPVTVFYDGAESASTTFTLSSTTTTTVWTRNSTSPFAGLWRWRAGSSTGGNYGNSGDARLTTPTLNLSGASTVTLTYAFKHSTEATFDFFDVRISTDGGVNYTNLVHVSGLSANWNLWAPLATINLNAYAGQTNVKIQFRLTSDTSVTDFGVAIDEVKVVKQ